MTLATIFDAHAAPARLEHININVIDPKRTAEMLCRLFGWSIRWEGPSINQGTSVHVGTQHDYVALYSNNQIRAERADKTRTSASLNHVALVVDDIDSIERRVVSEGFTPHSFADYEPGQRFYFHDFDDVEYEVVSYGEPDLSFWDKFRKELSHIARNSVLFK
jgi:catechol 2,3-dioxygenase-like lactoylglutathione lyase family enzyme